MVHLSFVFVALGVISAQAAPILQKRIAQTIADSTAKWEQACLAAGGGQECNPASIAAFSTLLAAPGPCDQQNAADALVDLSKKLKSSQMIALSQIFAQQPRNTPNSQAVPYCQQAPKNAELNGLFQCQFAGANQQKFVGGLAVGAPGTIPFGRKAALNPLGSCPANPNGPIADGTQLSDITTNPNAPGGSGAPAPAAAPSPVASPAPAATPSPVVAEKNSGATPAAGDFKVQNGKDAQALNKQFATLTADSPCTAGQNACVGGGFAQCVGSKFVVTPCGATLTCSALPLVNKAGTSIACTTQADAIARIQASGATGGLTG